MSVEDQSPNFAKEYVRSALLSKVLLSSLLALSILCNGFLAWKLVDTMKDLNSMGQVLNQTQEELLDKEASVQKEKDEVAAKAVARILQNAYKLDEKYALEVAKYEIKYSRKYGIPLHIGLAITAKESGFKNGLISYNGSSYGLKQINCFWWCKEFNTNKEQLRTDIKKNIESGYKVLAVNLKRHGTMEKALAAYLGTHDAEENRKYALAVLSQARLFNVGV